MLANLTHRQLEAFRAVIETGKVTTAAQNLSTTQPSVSRMISDLEYGVGFALFERRGRQLIPTSEALDLYEEVKRSFIGLSEISRVAEDIRNFRTGSLTIAGMPALALKFLPDVIASFIQAEPGVTISLRTRSSQAVLRHVSSQQFDLGFASIEMDHPSVKRQPIYTAPMKAVLPIGHPLSHKGHLIPSDFHEQPFVALGSEISTRLETDAFIAEGKAQPHVVAEAQLSASICELVSRDVGISIVEPVTAANFAAAGKVIMKDLHPSQIFRYDLLTPAQRQPSRLTTKFLAMVEKEFAKLLPLKNDP